MSVGQDFDPSLLDRKDRTELAAIATSLGEKPPARAKKAEMVALILRLVGAEDAASPADAGQPVGDDAGSAESVEGDGPGVAMPGSPTPGGDIGSRQDAAGRGGTETGSGAGASDAAPSDQRPAPSGLRSGGRGVASTGAAPADPSGSDADGHEGRAQNGTDPAGSQPARPEEQGASGPGGGQDHEGPPSGAGRNQEAGPAGRSGPAQPSRPQSGANQSGGSQFGGNQPGANQARGNQQGGGNQPSGNQPSGNKQNGGNRQNGGNQQDGGQGGPRGQDGGQNGGRRDHGGQNRQEGRADTRDEAGPGNQADPQPNQAQGGQGQFDDEAGNRRRRRRGRDRDRRPDQGDDQGPLADPVEVTGIVDLRDEGYGFLRIAGYLPTRDDAYISVKQARQFDLRKGDTVKGRSRPANRNEKNPALLQVDEVNGRPANGQHPARPHFEDLTPLFPDSRLRLEQAEFPENMTARIIDLLAPIGKGQRGLIVSPPKAGKTTVMKQIVRAVERNHPDVHLIVLLVDERPEEVTDMRRWLISGEVAASTFDRPTDEHIAISELALERAKRLVETGRDVVIVLDGITRLARAYNLAAPNGGRTMAGGIDTGALYPPKKFFGAARNVEEGGSLTILATALVETGTRMDEVIFEEFKGTGNMELKLDRRLADRRIYPAIDVDASSTRHEELLYDRKQVQQIYRLRRVLSALKDDGGSSAAGLEMLTDRLKTFRTNDAFLDEIAKTPTQT